MEPPDGVQRLNPVLHGWGNFYRHAWGAKRVFAGIDHYVWWTIKRWLHKKQPDTRMDQLAAQYGWHKPRQRTALARRCDGSRCTGRDPCRALSAGLTSRSPLCVNIQGEPGTQCKAHAGFGEGHPETRSVKAPAGVGCPLPTAWEAPFLWVAAFSLCRSCLQSAKQYCPVALLEWP